jgi:molybdenum cofactor biosynthesis enzyme
MEALTAVQVGLLTIYDMCKAATAAWSCPTSASPEARRQIRRLECDELTLAATQTTEPIAA